MSLLDNALYAIMNGKKTITETVFLKDFEKESQQLKDLIELSNKVTSDKKEIIDRDITLMKHGMDGENNVYFELKNSFIPMICLHDIRIEYKDYVAQIDFIAITHKFIYVLETKKLNGDIEITYDGDFIRSIKSSAGKTIKKEGMYSPISQNERHVKILRELLTKEGIIKTFPIKSAVIIANPKSIINKLKCPKAIQNNIYKYDQLTNLLKKELTAKNEEIAYLEKNIYKIAEFLINNHKPIAFDNIGKYSLADEDFATKSTIPTKTNTYNKPSPKIIPKETIQPKVTPVEAVQPIIIPKESVQPMNNEDVTTSTVYKLLKEYRLKASRDEGIKPYLIYNNDELETLIRENPASKNELLQVKGFGPKKVDKYGDSILSILKSSS